jgi:geranylgeranyl diphosphate synthase type I
MGAVIGSEDPATAVAFRACGASLGCVFQIRDDILGVWGDEETIGKPVGADIRRKKNSFPMVYAISQTKSADRRLLKEIYQKEHLDDGDVAEVLDVMERGHVKEHAERLAADRSGQALDALAGVDLAPDARREVEELLDFMLVRQH